MRIIKGINNGAVLQRDEKDFCKVTLFAEFTGNPKISLGKLTHIENNKWELSEIYIGGPYSFTIEDDVDAVTFTNIYVGDLWLLAGQSNMEGAGQMTPDDEIENIHSAPFLRAFYMNDTWDEAKPILHHLHLSNDPAHIKVCSDNEKNLIDRGITVYDHLPYLPKRRVGPGYFFIKEMYLLTEGIPQGVIPAAVGGAPIEMWLPVEDGEENYYAAACRRITETGSNIRGVFWAQGEGNPHSDRYPSQIESIRKDLCKKLGKDVLPFVQMQSFKCTLYPEDRNSNEVWSRFREMQRKMPQNTDKLTTIATNDLELDDCIHLSSDAQKSAGMRGARAMYYLITGCGFAEPELEKVYLKQGRFVPQVITEIHVRYRNLAGQLRASGVPNGFSLRAKGEEKPSCKMFRKIILKQNEIVIVVEIPIEKLFEYELWYGYGNDFYCNIIDGQNRAIPAMGPIALK